MNQYSQTELNAEAKELFKYSKTTGKQFNKAKQALNLEDKIPLMREVKKRIEIQKVKFIELNKKAFENDLDFDVTLLRIKRKALLRESA